MRRRRDADTVSWRSAQALIRRSSDSEFLKPLALSVLIRKVFLHLQADQLLRPWLLSSASCNRAL